MENVVDNEKFTEYSRGDMYKNISAIGLHNNVFHTVHPSHVYR